MKGGDVVVMRTHTCMVFRMIDTRARVQHCFAVVSEGRRSQGSSATMCVRQGGTCTGSCNLGSIEAKA
mgnify:CR=1 FL=1